jgi:hypothetical protein
MDLWIRSQDRKRLVPNPNLFIVTNENGISYIGDITVGHIAEYNTEKRALEVLDEIHECLEDDVFRYTKDGYPDIPKNTAVYEMPNE